MYIDRVLYPVQALGPGNRIVIWTAGCRQRCIGCANPELWTQHPEQEIAPQRLADSIRRMIRESADGITISGGEPFLQASELSELLELLPFQGDILVFSGYTYETLLENDANQALLKKTDVLIDGAYQDDLNDGKSALRGSVNQRILYLNPQVKDRYEQYLHQGRLIQNFVYDYHIISVGIHNPGVRDIEGNV